MFVSTDETGRIGATTDRAEFAGGMKPFEFPEGFDFGHQYEYRIDGGALVHDPLPAPEPAPEPPDMAETAAQAAAELGVLTATTAESVADLGAVVAALSERVAALESR